jgi:hypothetical protein
MRLPSELNAAFYTSYPWSSPIALPVSAFHSRAVLSSEAVTMRLPSGLNAALLTPSICPWSSPIVLPVSASHSRAGRNARCAPAPARNAVPLAERKLRNIRYMDFLDQSALIFNSCASRAYLAKSSPTRRENCSIVPPTGSCACCAKLSRIAVSASALLISTFRRMLIAVGVPLGTNTPIH